MAHSPSRGQSATPGWWGEQGEGPPLHDLAVEQPEEDFGAYAAVDASYKGSRRVDVRRTTAFTSDLLCAVA